MAAAAVAEDIIRTSALAIPGLPLLIRDPSMDGPEADEACRKRTSDDRRSRRRRVHPHPQPPNKNEAEEGGGGGMVHRREHDHPRCLVPTAGDLRRFHPDLHDGHTLRCGILPDGIGAAREGNPRPADVPILDDDGAARSDIHEQIQQLRRIANDRERALLPRAREDYDCRGGGAGRARSRPYSSFSVHPP